MIFELSGYQLSDESKLPDFAYFLDKLNHYRSVSLREIKVIPESMYTESNCNEVKCEGQQCVLNGKTFTSPNRIHYVEVGQLFDNVGWYNIRYFGLDGYRQNFTRVHLSSFMGQGKLEYDLGIPVYTLVGNYAMIRGLSPECKLISMSALHANPHMVCGQGLDQPYPCPSNILERAIRLVKMDALTSMGITLDRINDNAIDTQQPQPKEA